MKQIELTFLSKREQFNERMLKTRAKAEGKNYIKGMYDYEQKTKKKR